MPELQAAEVGREAPVAREAQSRVTIFQREILTELRHGASLRLRFSRFDEPGDFLLVKRGKIAATVPRKTVRAICRIVRKKSS